MRALLEWYEECQNHLFEYDEHSLVIAESEVGKVISKVYDPLKERVISYKMYKNRISDTHCGPTGAAKILFALRPNMFAPGDGDIKNESIKGENAVAYFDYLKIVISKLIELQRECEIKNIDSYDLPNQLNRSVSSLLKLIDEYFWVIITNDCNPFDLIKNFNKWSKK